MLCGRCPFRDVRNAFLEIKSSQVFDGIMNMDQFPGLKELLFQLDKAFGEQV